MVCLFRPSSLVGVWLFYTDYFVSSCNAEWGKGVLHSKLPADYTPVLISKWIQGCDLVINPIWMWLSCIRINPINFKSFKQVLYWMLLWLTGTCANHNAQVIDFCFEIVTALTWVLSLFPRCLWVFVPCIHVECRFFFFFDI